MAMRGPEPIDFDVWGSRGSHNIVPATSRISNHTSCYSMLCGEDVFVFDAGRGMVILGNAMLEETRFRDVRNVHVLVTHAHLDHWEGLKDVDWFWRRGNGLNLRIHGTRQALLAIRRGFAHPAYVPLDILAQGTVASLAFVELGRGERREIGPWLLETCSLNHYAGGGDNPIRRLDTLGYRLTLPKGPCVAYLSDHEPTSRTAATEEAMVDGSHVSLFDAHFGDVRQHCFGHGSQEHAAGVARQHPHTLVLAGHHSPMTADAELQETKRRHGRGIGNYRLAIEGSGYRWNKRTETFEPRTMREKVRP
jgi:phosphoribosyl 1,2-cyclic phosphodiesterase